VSADVLGMAGPGKTIAAVMPCTVIAQGDFIDRILDRKQHPLWRGERTKLLKTMPKDLDAWERYFEVYRAGATREPPDRSAADAYYRAYRAELDAGPRRAGRSGSCRRTSARSSTRCTSTAGTRGRSWPSTRTTRSR
jgi:hypothetical protein